MTTSPPPLLIALNGGSSSLKFALFRADDSRKRLLAGKIDRVGLTDSLMKWRVSTDSALGRCLVSAPDHIVAARLALDCVEKHAEASAVAAVGHRVVHGGMKYTEPVMIDRVPGLGERAACAKQFIRDKLIEHRHYMARTCRRCAGGNGATERSGEKK